MAGGARARPAFFLVGCSPQRYRIFLLSLLPAYRPARAAPCDRYRGRTDHRRSDSAPFFLVGVSRAGGNHGTLLALRRYRVGLSLSPALPAGKKRMKRPPPI